MNALTEPRRPYAKASRAIDVKHWMADATTIALWRSGCHAPKILSFVLSLHVKRDVLSGC